MSEAVQPAGRLSEQPASQPAGRFSERQPYRRVIACLDFKDGRVVKGLQFAALQDAGDPVELAGIYSQEGADELVFLDIAASVESRPTVLDMAAAVRRQCTIPFIVGGGMSSVADIEQVLGAGADMVSLNSAALRQPDLVDAAALAFGSQRLIVAIDAKRAAGGADRWTCLTQGGQVDTGIDVLDWARDAARRGAGQILLTSLDGDGAKSGYDLALTRAVARSVVIPVVASGGAGRLEDFAAAILEGEADAVLAAGVFHYGLLSIRAVKEYMANQGIPVRL